MKNLLNTNNSTTHFIFDDVTKTFVEQRDAFNFWSVSLIKACDDINVISNDSVIECKKGDYILRFHTENGIKTLIIDSNHTKFDLDKIAEEVNVFDKSEINKYNEPESYQF